jgi:hypothetical protein
MKKQQKSICNEQKLEVINWLGKKNECIANICHAVCLAKITVQTVHDNYEKIISSST